MQLTRAADYAMRVMIYLAGLPEGTRVSRGELADAAECPEQFLSKVLQSLSRAGLVISHRGNTGGFELLPGTAKATVLQVVEAVEGPVRLNVCVNSPHPMCNRQSWCPVHPVWEDAQAAMTQVLRATTIRELAEQAAVNLTRGNPLEAPITLQ
jgi:Rrf2 family protein